MGRTAAAEGRPSSAENTGTASTQPGREKATHKHPNFKAFCLHSSHCSNPYGQPESDGVHSSQPSGAGMGAEHRPAVQRVRGSMGSLPSPCSWLWESFNFTAWWSRWLHPAANLSSLFFSPAHPPRQLPNRPQSQHRGRSKCVCAACGLTRECSGGTHEPLSH